MKIAIVGSEEKYWTKDQEERVKEKILRILNIFCLDPTILVSGHCHRGGVDIWAEEIADGLGIEKEIYPAQVKRWSGKGGYRDRNVKIAKACDVLYDIEPRRGDVFRQSGGTWTLKYARQLGKEAHVVVIE